MIVNPSKAIERQPEAIFTIGHSTHPIEEFIDILKAYDIGILVDIRTIPRSRHNPQFSGKNLSEALEKAAIKYIHMKDLGGLRHAKKDSPNQGWRNLSFRGYADYMQTEEFRQALNELIALGKQSRTAIMCAEAVPWRCHRSLVGDALTVRGIDTYDIFSKQKIQKHKLNPMAKVSGTEITYPKSVERQELNI